MAVRPCGHRKSQESASVSLHQLPSRNIFSSSVYFLSLRVVSNALNAFETEWRGRHCVCWVNNYSSLSREDTEGDGRRVNCMLYIDKKNLTAVVHMGPDNKLT
jgi:hypothetical protein